MFHRVVQVVPTNDFRVYIFFEDGKIKLFDASSLVTKGVFQKLQDISVFKDTCTVLNHTLAWDLEGKYDPTKCLDLDPEGLYNSSPDVIEPKVRRFYTDRERLTNFLSAFLFSIRLHLTEGLKVKKQSHGGDLFG